MNTRPPLPLLHHHHHPPTKLTLPYPFAPALFLDCLLHSAWSVILWSVTQASVCHSGVRRAGKREEPCKRKKNKKTIVVLMLVCGGIQGQSDWGLIFQMFFFFFWYFICFVLGKPQWKTKQRSRPCLLFMEAVSYLRVLSRFMFFPFFPLLQLCIYLIWRSLFSHCSYATDLTTSPFFITMNPNTSILYWSLHLGHRCFFPTASAYGIFKSMNNFSFHFQAGFCHKFPSAVLFAWFFFFCCTFKINCKKNNHLI